MATTRTAKVEAEIEKAKAKLVEQQAKVKELEHKKTEIENTEIVDIVRGMSIPLDGLATLLQNIKGGALPVTASGQNVPKFKATTRQNDNPDEEENDE